MKKFTNLLTGAILLLALYMVATAITGCGSMRKAKQTEVVRRDSTATEVKTEDKKTDISNQIQTTTQDTAATQKWWTEETETMVDERLDTAGRVVERKTTQRTKSTGREDQRTGSTTSTTQNTHVAQEGHSSEGKAATVSSENRNKDVQTTTRWNATPLFVVAALIILIWMFWPDMVQLFFAIFKRRK